MTPQCSDTTITGQWVKCGNTIQRFSRAVPRGRAREWAALGVHPLSWLLSNNRLEEVCGTLTKGTFSSRLLLSNQDKGCIPCVAHSLPLPLPLPLSFCSTCLMQHKAMLVWRDLKFFKIVWKPIFSNLSTYRKSPFKHVFEHLQFVWCYGILVYKILFMLFWKAI